MSSALITGVTGQDGTYLAELLLAQGYRVVGLTRDVAAARRGHAGGILRDVQLVEGSLTDAALLQRLVEQSQPREIYNLAGQTRVSASWDDPVETGDSCGLAVARLLAIARAIAPEVRFLQASSAEMFAPEVVGPADESSPFRPISPYGAAKLYAHHLVGAYRDVHGMYAVSAILFNHESPRRSEAFVTRRITRGVARIARGEATELRLGNLDVRRDWGFAGDYVRAMWMMLQRDEPEDFVIGTGEAHSVADFCHAAFRAAGLDWREYVRSDPGRHRPGDVPVRLANPARARTRLGWTPEVDFDRLVEMMVRHDLGAA